MYTYMGTPGYIQMHQGTPGCARVCPCNTNHTRINPRMPGHTQISQGTPEYIWACPSVPGHTQVQPGMPGCAKILRVCLGTSGMTRYGQVCPGIPGHPGRSRKNPDTKRTKRAIRWIETSDNCKSCCGNSLKNHTSGATQLSHRDKMGLRFAVLLGRISLLNHHLSMTTRQ
jgi:hypothetical protein